MTDRLEAKDTVMPGSRKDSILWASGSTLDLINKLCEAQAEITWDIATKTERDRILDFLRHNRIYKVLQRTSTGKHYENACYDSDWEALEQALKGEK